MAQTKAFSAMPDQAGPALTAKALVSPETWTEIVKGSRREFPHSYSETVDGDHGRVESRRIWVTSALDWFQDKKHWPGLRSLGMVEAQRDLDGKVSAELRYFISSLADVDAERFVAAVRNHWSIDYSLHWCLGISFREDDCRIRQGHAAENFGVLRHIALNCWLGPAGANPVQPS